MQRIPTAANLISNGDFHADTPDTLPEGWHLPNPFPALQPTFAVEEHADRPMLALSAPGNEDAVGWIANRFTIQRGKTYHFQIRFHFTADVNPQFHLLFSLYCGTESGGKFQPDFNQGLFRFHKLADAMAEGENRFFIPGEGVATAEVRLAWRLNPTGKAWIESVTLEPCPALEPRLVRLACVENCDTASGIDKLRPRNESWSRVIDAAAKDQVDLILLPEEMNGQEPEPADGPTCQMMAEKARQHRMHVAGGVILREGERVYNTTFIYNRQGHQVGRYDKHHLYSPELMDLGITPGIEVPVFKLDFGAVGIMTCYDNWFPDVAQLLALRGAEVILFPNAGHMRSLLPARAADNGVRIIASTHFVPLGMWDSAGTDLQHPESDPTIYPGPATAYRDVILMDVGEIKLMCATFDLAQTPLPHYWGGPMLSAPGSLRNRLEQKTLLQDEIKAELQRWWCE